MSETARRRVLAAFLLTLGATVSLASNALPTFLEQPGSVPGDLVLEAAQTCELCHFGYDPASEPGFAWQGSMMAHAARDPILWAALAIAEQDLVPNETAWAKLMPSTTPERGGAGALCLRCHSPSAFVAGRTLPSGGGALAPEDYQGVGCDSCHRLVDPKTAEGMALVRPGREAWWTDPDTSQVDGFYGAAQAVLDILPSKRGPFDDPLIAHESVPSPFQREGDLCGTCHDVSNPAVGELAPGSGRLDGMSLGTNVAFAYPPYAYGTVERTYSEWKASAWPALRTADFATLPASLRLPAGAPERASRLPDYNSSSSPAFNPPRTYSCQTCHLQSVTGQGCNAGPEVRTDLPFHDLVGGNTWGPLLTTWLSAQGKLRGGPLAPVQEAALAASVERARALLRRSAALEALTSGDGLSLVARVTNLTGHKLPTGYPEGRRAWLNVRFYDASGALLAERGRYDPASADLTQDTRVYQARRGLGQAWAQKLIDNSWDPGHPLTFTPAGLPERTLAELASGSLGPALETFHFVLNDQTLADSRIPPYGLDPAAAAKRNASPVPAGEYPLLGDGTYRYWDEASFPLPAGAARAEVRLYYQTASREYIDFLRQANTTTTDGADVHDAWAATGMSPPELLAVAYWIPGGCAAPPPRVADLRAVSTAGVDLTWSPVPGASFYRVYRHRARDRSDSPDAVATTDQTAHGEPVLDDGVLYFYDVRAVNECGESGP